MSSLHHADVILCMSRHCSCLLFTWVGSTGIRVGSTHLGEEDAWARLRAWPATSPESDGECGHVRRSILTPFSPVASYRPPLHDGNSDRERTRFTTIEEEESSPLWQLSTSLYFSLLSAAMAATAGCLGSPLSPTFLTSFFLSTLSHLALKMVPIYSMMVPPTPTLFSTKIQIEIAVVEGKEKGPVIVEEAKKQEVALLVLGQKKRSMTWRLIMMWASNRATGGVVEYCIQNADCMAIAVRRKSQKHGGYLITTKRHKDFWLLA
ncbi:hypothetical protein NC653_020942 [Populus alba x Populus x berolinensis]|uniref:UspA domain-containing protein n=1 Tax=Populus alba x Populus x berolinensis TaxID=444605 RepID=A0AAD6QD74_9ROSI|nr:hypothetical protein NC653_020942 [Populus alba x Populus x berolinensis]